MIRKYLKYIFLFILIGSFLTFNISIEAKKAQKKTITTKIKTRKKAKAKNVPKLTEKLLIDSLISPGIRYKNILISDNRRYISTHIIEADLTKKNISLEILKAGNQMNELKKIQDIINNFESKEGKNIIAAINANFWRAYSNYPIGPTIKDGYVIEMKTHKRWSSCFFTKDKKPFIDNFFIEGTVTKKNGWVFNLISVNRRRDSLGAVLYNKFAGDSIPYVPINNYKKEYLKALELAKSDIEYQDTTDFVFDSVAFAREFQSNKRFAMLEYGLPKYTLKILSEPAVNKDIICRVVKFDTIPVHLPEDCFILSFGKETPPDYYPEVGDTLKVRFSTNVHSEKVFYNSVAGTPRIVRQGKVSNEAVAEGSRSRRFINYPLPRTAIGFDRAKTKFFMVTIGGNNGKGLSSGASLSKLGYIMKQIGCYDAMNLDGGGSSVMLVNGKNIVHKNNPDYSRRISVALGISIEP